MSQQGQDAAPRTKIAKTKIVSDETDNRLWQENEVRKIVNERAKPTRRSHATRPGEQLSAATESELWPARLGHLRVSAI
jgi:hypothetical protein